MQMNELLKKLEDLLELEDGSLTLETKLNGIAGWDSMAVISFIAFADSEFGKSVKGQDIQKCDSVQNLIDLIA